MLLLPVLNWGRCFGARYIWTASSESGTNHLCEQWRFRQACACAQSRQNLRCSLIQAVSQEEPSDRKPDPWPLWMAGHAQLKFVMTECSKTQIRLTRLKYRKHTIMTKLSLNVQKMIVSAFKSDQSQPWSQISLSLQVRSVSALKSDQSQPSSQISLSLQVRSVSAIKSDQSQPSSQISLSLQVRSVSAFKQISLSLQIRSLHFMTHKITDSNTIETKFVAVTKWVLKMCSQVSIH